MGGHFQTIVDRDVREADAPAFAEKLRDWLLSQEIIAPAISGCLLGDEAGHPPGHNYERVCGGVDSWAFPLKTLTNGLRIINKRCVFHAGQGAQDLVCRRCQARIRDLEQWLVMGEAISQWFQHRPCPYRCPRCGNIEPIIDRKWDPPYGFGNLGFEFWNWPDFTPAFIDEVARQLGHRVILVSGKL